MFPSSFVFRIILLLFVLSVRYLSEFYDFYSETILKQWEKFFAKVKLFPMMPEQIEKAQQKKQKRKTVKYKITGQRSFAVPFRFMWHFYYSLVQYV